MTRPIKPPRGIFIPSRVLYHPAFFPALRDTLIQLLALAWSSPSRDMTPPLTYPMLAELTGKTIASLHGHIAILRKECTALRLQYTASGTFIIQFAGWLFNRADEPKTDTKFLVFPYQEEEEVNCTDSDSSEILLPPPDDHDQGFAPKKDKRRTPRRKKSPASAFGFGAHLESALCQAGIFPSLFQEIADSQRDDIDLLALLDWAREDNPQGTAALFIGRLRAGALVPPRFYMKPCRCCGQREGHAPTCYLRYAQDEDI